MESHSDSAAAAPRETYSHGYSPDLVQRVLGSRSAAYAAAFLRPYLRPGMRLLDCGCGPGSITVGLAEFVAPGEVVGLDSEPSQVAAAQALAQARGLTTVHCQVGSVYDLPFPDGSFDVVFAHTLLEHLHEPVQALREMRRVLRPTGLIGVRDGDSGTLILEPSSPLRQLALALATRLVEHNGGDPYLARKHRRLLREAGFGRTVASTSAGEQVGSLAATRLLAEMIVRYLHASTFEQVALEQGWADPATLAAMDADLRAWGEDPDAFYGVLYCEAVGWVRHEEVAPSEPVNLYRAPAEAPAGQE